jgi:hypothetical protein
VLQSPLLELSCVRIHKRNLLSPGGSLLLIMIIVRLLPPEPVGWLAPPKFTRVGFGTRPIQFPHRPPLLTAVVQWTQDGFVVQEEKRTQVLDAGRPAPGQAGGEILEKEHIHICRHALLGLAFLRLLAKHAECIQLLRCALRPTRPDVVRPRPLLTIDIVVPHVPRVLCLRRGTENHPIQLSPLDLDPCG